MAVSIYTEEFVSQKHELGSCSVTVKNCKRLETRIRNVAVQHVNGMDHFKLFCEMTVWLVHGIKLTEMV